ncbi:MAG TPA: PLP-dependent aminotransferase family protein, partial [Amycolatopsis sp.]|nr:PLP-dependent aminotransferase family protein [Amycolatopsis sp.]
PAPDFGYGPDLGAPELRDSLATYLARSRGVVADPARIVVCNGFSHALGVLTRALHGCDVDEIAFENPSLFLYRDIVAAHGPRVVGIDVDQHGLDVSALDSPAVVVTAAHQYPTGVTLAPHRRAALARWAGESAAFVLEDDYDGEFRFDNQQVGALQALAPERVVYAGTASKTLAPALRLAWLVLPRSLVEPVRTALAETGARPPVLTQLTLAALIDSGDYDRHIRRCRAEYRARRVRLLEALPKTVTPHGISAGLHLLLMLPDGGPSEAEVLAACRRRSLGIGSLADYWMDEGRPGGLIVGYAAAPKHAFAGATQALVEALWEMKDS